MSSKIKFNLIHWRNLMSNEKTYDQAREQWVDSQHEPLAMLDDRRETFEEIKNLKREINAQLCDITQWYFLSAYIEEKGFEIAYQEELHPDHPDHQKIHDLIQTITNTCPTGWLERYGDMSSKVDELAINGCVAVAKLRNKIKALHKVQENNWEKYSSECARLRDVYDANQKEKAARQVQEADK